MSSKRKRGLQLPDEQDAAELQGQEHYTDNFVGNDSAARTVPVSLLTPSPDQPRRTFEPEALAQLAENIAEHGLINAVTVVEEGEAFRVVAGERRFRAVQNLGWTQVPVRIVNASEARAIQLAENLHRENLPLLEEAQALAALKDELDLTTRELAERVHKSSSYVDRRLQILNWPKDVQAVVADNPGFLTKAAAIAGIGDAELRNRQIQNLLNDDPVQVAPRTASTPARGRPPVAYKFTPKKLGGFDLSVKFRPGTTDREELIDKLRGLINDLEQLEKPK